MEPEHVNKSAAEVLSDMTGKSAEEFEGWDEDESYPSFEELESVPEDDWD